MSTKIAIYARVSTEDQRDLGTIENQLYSCREHASGRSYEVEEVYSDEGVSGTVPLAERPGGEKLLQAAADGRFALVLVHRLDRLARDALQCLLAIERLKRAKVGVESVREAFDDSPSGDFARTVMTAVSELERSLIRERTSEGRRRKVRDGHYLASKAPYGYDRDPEAGGLVINEEQARWVREIFRWATEENLGSQAIAAKLDEARVAPPFAGHPTRGSRFPGWAWSTVAKLLKAERYTGSSTYAGQSMRCPAIIDRATFEATQAALTRRKFDAKRNTRRPYLLQNLLWCRHCGGRYHGRRKWVKVPEDRSPNGAIVAVEQTWYECGPRKIHGEKAGHEGIVWRLLEDDAAPRIKRIVEGLINAPENVLAEWDLTIDAHRTAAQSSLAEVAAIKKRLDTFDAQRTRMVDAFKRGLIDSATFEDQLETIRNERAADEAELRRLEGGSGDGSDTIAFLEMLKQASLSRARQEIPATYTDEETGQTFAEPDLAVWKDRFARMLARVWVEPDGALTLEGPGGVIVSPITRSSATG